MRIWPLYRFEIVQKFVDSLRATHYLEIGTQTAASISRIKVDYKTAVDPDPIAEMNAKSQCKLRNNQKSLEFSCMTSDDFFENFIDPKFSGGFDVIFIDGMHEREQWKRDVVNAKRVLNPGGVIICHDCNPPDEHSQLMPPRDSGEWVGDVWKGWVDLRQSVDDEMFVVDTDYGVGVIIPNSLGEKLDPVDELTYKNLTNNRKDWLNLVSVDEFYQKFEDCPSFPDRREPSNAKTA